MTELETALSGAASALKASAREHKRASSAHRRQARETMQALAKLREVALAAGLKIVITEGEGKYHGQ